LTVTEEREKRREKEREERRKLREECERNPLFSEEQVTRTNSTVNRDEVMAFDEDGRCQRMRISLTSMI
jgi:hypothetical protein